MLFKDTHLVFKIILFLFLVQICICLIPNNQINSTNILRNTLRIHNIKSNKDLKQKINLQQHKQLQQVNNTTINANLSSTCKQIINSILFINITTNITSCTCPNLTQIYPTTTGYKCLRPEPIQYPQFVDLICGFFAFVIPAVVAYVCRHKQQVERHRQSIHHIGGHKHQQQHHKQKTQIMRNQLKQQQLNKLNQYHENRNYKCKQIGNEALFSSINTSKYYMMERSQVKPMGSQIKLPRFASSTDLKQIPKLSKSRRQLRYASSTDSPRAPKYASAIDI